jgi:hypothetical protein
LPFFFFSLFSSSFSSLFSSFFSFSSFLFTFFHIFSPNAFSVIFGGKIKYIHPWFVIFKKSTAVKVKWDQQLKAGLLRSLLHSSNASDFPDKSKTNQLFF